MGFATKCCSTFILLDCKLLHPSCLDTQCVKDIKPKLTQISGPCPHHRCLDQTASSMRHRFHINMISSLALWSRQIVHKTLKWEIWSHLQLHLSSVLQTFISGENKNKKRKEILNKMTKRENISLISNQRYEYIVRKETRFIWLESSSTTWKIRQKGWQMKRF